MSSPRGTNPLEPGEVLTLGALALLAGLHLLGWLSSALASVLAGHGWQPLPARDVTVLLVQWPHHLDEPALAFPPRTRHLLPGTAGMWFALLLASALILLAGTALTRLATRLASTHPPGRSGTGQGLASRGEVRRHLGERAVRARTPQTRPSLTGRHYRTAQVGLSLGHDTRTGQPIWGSVEDSYLILGPPRSGKGVHLIIPRTLDAPGAVLVTSTRPDTLRATQTRRAEHGPVLAFDPQQLAADTPRLRWSPTRGCADPLVAINRARALAAGAHLAKGTTSDGEFWTAMAAAVLRAYLHAAALGERPIRDVLAWAAPPQDPTPVQDPAAGQHRRPRLGRGARRPSRRRPTPTRQCLGRGPACRRQPGRPPRPGRLQPPPARAVRPHRLSGRPRHALPARDHRRSTVGRAVDHRPGRGPAGHLPGPRCKRAGGPA